MIRAEICTGALGKLLLPRLILMPVSNCGSLESARVYQLPEAPPPLLEPPDELRLLELLLDELLPPRPLLLLTPPGKKPNSIASPKAMPIGSQEVQSGPSGPGGFS